MSPPAPHGPSDAARPEELLIALGEPPSDEVGVAGTRAATLARLVRAGLPVPGGFVVTTGAFWRFIAESGLSERVRSTFAAGTGEDELARVGKQLEREIEGQALPAWLEQPLHEAYFALTARGSEHAVAIRPSPVHDEPAAAHQLSETRLYARGEEEVGSALRHCFAALFAPHLVLYRARRGLDQAAAATGAIVQQQVLAVATGLLLGADSPAAPDRLVLEARSARAPGKVVGAAVDRYVLERRTGEQLTAQISPKVAIVEATATGGVALRHLSPGSTETPVVTDEQIQDLVDLARRVEHERGAPQVLEWVIDADGRAWIVRSEPAA